MFFSNQNRFEFVFPRLLRHNQKVSDAPDMRTLRFVCSQNLKNSL